MENPCLQKMIKDKAELVFTMDIDCNLCEIRIDFLCINYMKVNPHSCS